MTAPQLAEHFEVSVRTIYRDIDALSAAGVPVYSAPGKGGGCPCWRAIPSTGPLSPRKNSSCCSPLCGACPGTPVRGRRGPCPSCPPCSGVGNRTGCRWSCPDGERRGRQRQIRPAQGGHSVPPRPVLHLCGRLRPDHPPQRPPRPAGLQGPGLVPPGFCLERAAYRTFKLTRMLEPEPGAPSAPLSPPIEAGEPPEGFCVPVRLRFSPPLPTGSTTNSTRAASPRADGSLVVSVSFPEDPWLYGYLLSFGLGWRYWNRSACGNGWRCWREKWRRITETMTRCVRITVIGWSHLNPRRNLT